MIVGDMLVGPQAARRFYLGHECLRMDVDKTCVRTNLDAPLTKDELCARLGCAVHHSVIMTKRGLKSKRSRTVTSEM